MAAQVAVLPVTRHHAHIPYKSKTKSDLEILSGPAITPTKIHTRKEGQKKYLF